ncbi:MAG: pyridoxamine 5'-phosphate oxidase family protein [Terracidiphilus sp.]
MRGARKQLELVVALLGEETTLSLATTGADGQACVASLFYIADKELSLYWLSSESSLHSLNLARTPCAAATVYRSVESWKKIRGVQLRGTVSKVTEPERRAALVKTYCERFKLGRALRLALRHSALYCLQPDFFRYIDNTRGFGYKFELTRGPEGWSLTRRPVLG